MAELAVVHSSPVPSGQMIQPQPPTQWQRRSFVGITPGTLASILKNAELGTLEDWADLTAFMLRTDGHLRSTYETRMLAIASADYDVKAGQGAPGQEAIAEKAADMFREEIERYRGWEGLINGLAHAEGVGYALGEHVWERRMIGGQIRWSSSPKMIAPRDIRFANNWTMQARTYDETGNYKWLDCEDEQHRYIVHVPTKLDRPTVGGELFTAAWLWLFKRWAQVFRQTALERNASGLLYGKTPPNATDEVRKKLREGLESLSSEAVAVFEQGVEVAMLEATRAPGEVWNTAIEKLDNEMTKLFIGSTDVVEAAHGSFARAETQVGSTLIPRLISIGKRIAGTIERDWAEPWCYFNSHLFGGKPPTPVLSFRFVQEEKPEVDELAVRVGAVTYDELREARGFEPWGKERGGTNKPAAAAVRIQDEDNVQQTALNGARIESLQSIVQSVAQGLLPRESGVQMIVAAFPLTVGQAEAIMGETGRSFVPKVEASAASPFPGSMKARRATSTQHRTLPISDASAQRIARVPFSPWDGQES